MSLLVELNYRAAHLDFLRIEGHAEAVKRNEDELLDITQCLDEHPDGYDGPCLCAMCCSYGE